MQRGHEEVPYGNLTEENSVDKSVSGTAGALDIYGVNSDSNTVEENDGHVSNE